MITAASPEWPAEKRWLEQQIAEAHKAMETPHLPEADTNMLRGEIAAYRKRIAAASAPAQAAESPTAPAPTPYV